MSLVTPANPPSWPAYAPLERRPDLARALASMIGRGMSGIGRAIMLAPGEGRAFTIGRDRVAMKGSSAGDDDGFSVVEYVGADQPGPPPHLHRTFEECWFILDGEVDFSVAGHVTRGRAGSFFLVPRGVTHTFQVVAPGPARWIGIFSPARYVRLIEELGTLIPADGPPDAAKVAALFAAYETDIVVAVSPPVAN